MPDKVRVALDAMGGDHGADVVVADINLGAAEAVAARLGGRAFEVDLAADFDAAARLALDWRGAGAAAQSRKRVSVFRQS